MDDTIHFIITQEGDDYIAQGVNFPVVTQAKTLDELSSNIREATDLALEGESPETFGLVADPTKYRTVVQLKS